MVLDRNPRCGLLGVAQLVHACTPVGRGEAHDADRELPSPEGVVESGDRGLQCALRQLVVGHDEHAAGESTLDLVHGRERAS